MQISATSSRTGRSLIRALRPPSLPRESPRYTYYPFILWGQDARQSSCHAGANWPFDNLRSSRVKTGVVSANGALVTTFPRDLAGSLCSLTCLLFHLNCGRSAEAFDQVFRRSHGVVLVGVALSVARSRDVEAIRDRRNSRKVYGVKQSAFGTSQLDTPDLESAVMARDPDEERRIVQGEIKGTVVLLQLRQGLRLSAADGEQLKMAGSVGGHHALSI